MCQAELPDGEDYHETKNGQVPEDQPCCRHAAAGLAPTRTGYLGMRDVSEDHGEK